MHIYGSIKLCLYLGGKTLPIFCIVAQEKREPPSHPRPHVPPCSPQHPNHAIGHVLAAVVAGALHYCQGSTVAHRKALPRTTIGMKTAARGAVQASVAANHVFVRQKLVLVVVVVVVVVIFGEEFGRRHERNRATVHPFADVIVGFAFQENLVAGSGNK